MRKLLKSQEARLQRWVAKECPSLVQFFTFSSKSIVLKGRRRKIVQELSTYGCHIYDSLHGGLVMEPKSAHRLHL